MGIHKNKKRKEDLKEKHRRVENGNNPRHWGHSSEPRDCRCLRCQSGPDAVPPCLGSSGLHTQTDGVNTHEPGL